MPITSKIKVGDQVWLRDQTKGTKEPFVTGDVINSQQGGKRITAKNSKTGEEVICDLSSADIFPTNPKDNFAPDHCALIHLNEPCILENSAAAGAQGRLPRWRAAPRLPAPWCPRLGLLLLSLGSLEAPGALSSSPRAA